MAAAAASASAGSLLFDAAAPGNAPAVPSVDATRVLIGGEIKDLSESGLPVESVISPVQRAGSEEHVELGKVVMCDEKIAMDAVNAAVKAYDAGRGEWPRMTPAARIAALEKFNAGFAALTKELAAVLMWEICKNEGDATKEVVRTVEYITATIADLKKLENVSSQMSNNGGVLAQVKRSPLGVSLCAGPFNYPLNELFTTMIPALAMGNTVVMKSPRIGGLVHSVMLELFRDSFPAGVINVVHGSGRAVFTPIMKSGHVNILAFIGTHTAAHALHSAHPRPFAVRLALGLDAKNPAFVLPSADLEVATSEVMLGALSFCGMRCTAVKIVFVHESIADEFVAKLSEKVDALKMGLPWDGANITPLPESAKPGYLRDVIADAEAKGAKVVNKRGNTFQHGRYAFPTVLFPVSLDARVAKEEQFGPVVPVVRYKDHADLEKYVTDPTNLYGQQAAVFTTKHEDLPPLVDLLAHHVTRININAQPQRGPDNLPFSGRKASATGTLSIHDALRTMSIRVAVATKAAVPENVGLFQDVLREGKSNILRAELLI